MTQELETATATGAEDEFAIDPFADFNNLLTGHLTGAPIPNGNTVLLDLCQFISQQDEAQVLRIIRNASYLRHVDLSNVKTSTKALELLLGD